MRECVSQRMGERRELKRAWRGRKRVESREGEETERKGDLGMEEVVGNCEEGI